jgi:hypothetical protein
MYRAYNTITILFLFFNLHGYLSQFVYILIIPRALKSVKLFFMLYYYYTWLAKIGDYVCIKFETNNSSQHTG